MSAVASLVSMLERYGDVILLVLGLAILLVVLLMVFVLVRARMKAKKDAKPPGPAPLPAVLPAAVAPASDKPDKPGVAGVATSSVSVRGLRQSFQRGFKVFADYVPGSEERYRVPWFLMLGETGAGKSTVLSSLELSRPPGEASRIREGRDEGVSWWIYDAGVVLDVDGGMLLSPDGRPVGDKPWHALLDLLVKHRGERPLDGVVLTIPASDLVGPDKLSQHAILERARALYAKLWDAQKILGASFPVHVVITKCDAVPGFQAFSAALPPTMRQQIFGWSSPYPLDSAYAAGRVDEALATMHQSLFQVQMELFAAPRETGDSDDIFQFPGELQSLAPGLRIYLDTLFKETAFHESLMLRGIYLVGDGGDEAAPEAAFTGVQAIRAPLLFGVRAGQAEPQAAAPGGIARPLFIDQLFAAKIFPENGLTRATGRAILYRNRRLLAYQAALAAVVVIGCFGLWFAWGRLSDGRERLYPALAEIPQVMRDVPVARGRDDTAVAPGVLGPTEERSVRAVLAAMGRTEPDWSWWLFPGRWISSLDGNLRQAMTLAYKHVVLSTAYIQLDRRGRDLVQAVGLRPGVGSAVLQPTDLPEFHSLATFAADFKQFEDNVVAFNALRQQDDIRQLPRLVKYLYNIDLPPDFVSRSRNIRLAEVESGVATLGSGVNRPFDLGEFQNPATARVRILAEAFHRKLFTSDRRIAQLQDVTRQLTQLLAAGGRSSADFQTLRLLAETLRSTRLLLSSADIGWLGGSSPNFGPAYDRMLQTIGETRLLGPTVRDQIRLEGETAFQRMQGELALLQSPATGPLLRREGGAVVLELSPTAQQLQASLATWLQQPFLNQTPIPRGVAVDTRTARRVVWDTGQLEQGLSLAEAYVVFAARELPNFPPALQGPVKAISLDRLDGAIRAKVIDAQRAVAAEGVMRGRVEDELRSDIRTFRAAAPSILRLLEALEQLQFAEAYGALVETASVQASNLLARVDRMLDEDQPYTLKPAGDWWRGGGFPVDEAFGVRSAADLPQYFEFQRQRLSLLARELAEPLVTFLTSPAVNRGRAYVPAVARWESIIIELDKFDNSKPDNAVTVLEKFISDALPKVEPGNCSAALGAAGSGADWFSARRAELRRTVQARCLSVIGEQGLRGYGEISGAFNELLAGRYPFILGADASRDVQADLASLREFFRIFDARAAGVREALKAKRFGPSGDRASLFMERMTRVRAFFAPMLVAGQDEEPVYSLAIDFRVNERFEAGANQVIDWKMIVGDQVVDNLMPQRRARWRFGDRIELAFRWAKDSRSVPAADAAGRPVTVTDRTIGYAFPEGWSLITLLQQHAAGPAELPQASDARQNVLLFPVQTEPARDGALVGREEDRGIAKLFVRVGLRAIVKEEGKPDREERIAFPTFPAEAPRLAEGG